MGPRSVVPLLTGDPTLEYRFRSKDHVAEIPATPLSKLTYSIHRNIIRTATFAPHLYALGSTRCPYVFNPFLPNWRQERGGGLSQ